MSEPTKPGDDIQVTLPVEFFDGLARMVRFLKQGLDDGTLGTVRRADAPPPGTEAAGQGAERGEVEG